MPIQNFTAGMKPELQQLTKTAVIYTLLVLFGKFFESLVTM